MLVEVEDQMAQGGQGAIVDRRAEHLGRTDAGIVMRQIFARGMACTGRGRPIQRWTMAPLIPRTAGICDRYAPAPGPNTFARAATAVSASCRFGSVVVSP